MNYSERDIDPEYRVKVSQEVIDRNMKAIKEAPDLRAFELCSECWDHTMDQPHTKP
jgi:hypothetical protein